MTPLDRIRVGLAFFLEFPRDNQVEQLLQTGLLRLAAFVTRMRGHQPKDHWWVLAPGWQWLRLRIIKASFDVGLVHASFTLIATAIAADAGGGDVASIDTSTALNVAAGDLLVDWCKHEGTTTTFATAKTSGGNSGTFDAGDKVTHSNGDLECAFGYVLSASADASHTRRLTFGAARKYPSLIVHQFRPDAGETVTKDASNTAQGNSTTPTSGAITTTGTDEAAIGGYGEYTTEVAASTKINAVAATGTVNTNIIGNYTTAWYRILAATFAGGNASGTISSAADWICNVISFKSVAGGGGAVGPLVGKRLVHAGILQGRLA